MDVDAQKTERRTRRSLMSSARAAASEAFRADPAAGKESPLARALATRDPALPPLTRRQVIRLRRKMVRRSATQALQTLARRRAQDEAAAHPVDPKALEVRRVIASLTNWQRSRWASTDYRMATLRFCSRLAHGTPTALVRHKDGTLSLQVSNV